MYVWSATYNGQTIPVRGDALYRTGETATVQVSGTSAPPATEPQPGPLPEPPVSYPGDITVGTGNDIMSFSFTTNGASIGVAGIAVDGVVVFQGNLASNGGGSSQFNIWYEGASGAHLSQVSYDGIEDFDQKQDRILFQEMAHESLSVTNQEAHLVLGFEGGSVTLHNGAKLDADQIILV
jgi:hypothetical protein